MVHPNTYAFWCWALVLVSLAGCDLGVPPRDRGAAPLGVGAEGEPLEHLVLGRQPSLVIGGDDSDPGATFHQITAATRLESGALAVANRGTAEIFVFDPAGRRIGTIGGPGGGPGEFAPNTPLDLVPARGDTVIVLASVYLQPQLSFFDPAGQLIHEVITPEVREWRGAFVNMTGSRAGFVFTLHGSAGESEQSAERIRLPWHLVRIGIATATIDTLGEYLGREIFYADVDPRPTFGGPPVAGPRAILPLFWADSWLAGGGEPFRVAVGDQAKPEVDLFDESGALLRTVRWAATGRVPTARDLRLGREAYVDHWMHQFDPGGARRALEVMPPVERTPVFRELRVDRLGRLWVERYPLPTDSLHAWWVFGPQGEPFAIAELPGDLRILEIGEDHLIGLARDPLDVERVEIWPLVRRTGEPSR